VGRLLVAGLCVVPLLSCAAMTKRAPKPIRDLNLPALIKDPKWIKGDCKSEMRSRGVLGLCAVVVLAKGSRPSNPLEISKSALEQGKLQLVDTTRSLLLEIVNTCQARCQIPDGPPRLDLVARLTKAAVDGARVLDTWLAADDNLYGMVSIDLGAFVKAINGNPDLFEEAKRELCDRARDSLR
jgi:hypothetical protein